MGCVTFKYIPLTTNHGFCLFFVSYGLISGEDILRGKKKTATIV